MQFLLRDKRPGSSADVCIVIPLNIGGVGGDGQTFEIKTCKLDLVADCPQSRLTNHAAAVGAGIVGVAHAKADIVVAGVDRPDKAAFGNSDLSR